jgi:hypothetical protein
VYLVGHSSGGAIIHGVAKKLKSKGIPVQMTAQIDSIGVGDAKIPDNVTRAFNFYYSRSEALAHGDFCLLTGENEISPQNSSSTTIVSNEMILDPQGPDDLSSYCGGHQNMDNDTGTWRPAMNYIIQSFGN